MDTRYRMTANAVLLYYQDCWARYMACLNMAAFDLVHQQQMWVITEFNACWETATAYWSQDVEVSVWNSELTGMKFYADFRMTKPDGSLIAHGSGCWTLLDTASHRPLAIAQALPEERLQLVGTERHRKERIPAGRNLLHEMSHRVNPINLDFNGHVNNRTYLSIAMQTVSGDFAQKQRLSRLTIRWQHETFLGDTLQCRLWDTEQANAYLAVISKEDNTGQTTPAMPVAQIYAEMVEQTDDTIIDNEAPRV